jgi:hypothetical protein
MRIVCYWQSIFCLWVVTWLGFDSLSFNFIDTPQEGKTIVEVIKEIKMLRTILQGVNHEL